MKVFFFIKSKRNEKKNSYKSNNIQLITYMYIHCSNLFLRNVKFHSPFKCKNETVLSCPRQVVSTETVLKKPRENCYTVKTTGRFQSLSVANVISIRVRFKKRI